MRNSKRSIFLSFWTTCLLLCIIDDAMVICGLIGSNAEGVCMFGLKKELYLKIYLWNWIASTFDFMNLLISKSFSVLLLPSSCVLWFCLALLSSYSQNTLRLFDLLISYSELDHTTQVSSVKFVF